MPLLCLPTFSEEKIMYTNLDWYKYNFTKYIFLT